MSDYHHQQDKSKEFQREKLKCWKFFNLNWDLFIKGSGEIAKKRVGMCLNQLIILHRINVKFGYLETYDDVVDSHDTH